MKKQWRQVSLLIIVVGLLGMPNNDGIAHSPTNLLTTPDAEKSAGLEFLVSASELVILGEVIDIQYRNSQPTREQPQGLPHTFVTYKVQEVLRGKAPGETITLRVPGGADGSGGIYLETNAPMFARSQTDVLFLEGGEMTGCPLVSCVDGRFRVVGDRVFNGWGIPVVEAGERLRIGGRPRFDLNVMELPRPAFEVLLKQPETQKLIEQESQRTGQSITELQRRYETEAPASYRIGYGFQGTPAPGDNFNFSEAEPIESFGPPLSVSAFTTAIRQWNERVQPPQTSVLSVDPNQSFNVADPKVDGVQAIAAPEQMTEEEKNDSQAREGETPIRDITPNLRNPSLQPISPELRRTLP
ncbi:hypothetical protein NIES970_20070 [[Synechococcus] sp. NIES-970]|nr:hypothetical protein NIES970_20070 [[Synechococcus] sp. NIES-970]